MPYKEPERKRQWEQQHREQRNAQRRKKEDALERARRITAKSMAAKKPAQPVEKPKSGWKTLLGFVVGFGVVLLVAMAGVNPPAPGE